MSGYTPIALPTNNLSRTTPNVFEHRAVHPVVYSWEVDSSVAASGSFFVDVGILGGFSVYDFSLFAVLDISFDGNRLADLILQVNVAGDSWASPNEEKRWALAVGNNTINYRPAARYGRFQVVNREAAVLSYRLKLSVRSL